jgi:hypothetical protein
VWFVYEDDDRDKDESEGEKGNELALRQNQRHVTIFEMKLSEKDLGRRRTEKIEGRSNRISMRRRVRLCRSNATSARPKQNISQFAISGRVFNVPASWDLHTVSHRKIFSEEMKPHLSQFQPHFERSQHFEQNYSIHRETTAFTSIST